MIYTGKSIVCILRSKVARENFWLHGYLIFLIFYKLFIQGNIKMRGIRKLAMFSRKLSFLKGSKLDLRAPALSQNLNTPPVPGTDGQDGKHGVDGPTGK